MALGKKKSNFNGKSSAPQTEAQFRNVGSIWESKQKAGSYRLVVNTDRVGKDGKEYPAAGRVLFEDAKTGELFLVKTMYLIEPRAREDGSTIAGLQFNVSLNLAQESSVEKLTAGDEAPDADYEAEEGDASASDYESGNDHSDPDSDDDK